MFHAHLAQLEVVGDVLLAGEVPQALALLSGLDVLVGAEMVRHQRDLVPVKNLGCPHAPELLYGDGRCDVVAQHQVQRALDELPSLHVVQPRVGGQYLLRHCHAHVQPSVFWSAAPS